MTIRSKPLSLAIDVCLGQCAAAVLSDVETLAGERETMERGHAEHLPQMARDVLKRAGVDPSELDLVVTTCGPGSFTGARLGVAFARGLALASGAKAVGVSCFDVLAAQHASGRLLAVIDGRRREFFVQEFLDGEPIRNPLAVAAEYEPLTELLERSNPALLIGPGATLLTETSNNSLPVSKACPDAGLVGQVGLKRFQDGTAESPKPIYMREPDAKPAAQVVGAT